jgi:hypothetical protein
MKKEGSKVYEKIRQVNNRLTWWVDPARPGQKPDCNPLTIFFFYQNDVVLIYKKNLELTLMTR